MKAAETGEAVETTRRDAAARGLIGRWLAAKREGLRATDLGVTLSPHSRSQSLTHFQVARLAGISVRSYQDLEAGRRTPGLCVLQRVIAALPITPTEAAYLHRLARAATCGEPTPQQTHHEDAAQALLPNRHSGCALVTNHRCEVLAADYAIKQKAPQLVEAGNLLVWLFTTREARHVLPDWEPVAAHLLADVRVTQSHHPHDIGWYEATMSALATGRPHVRRMWRDSLLRIDATRPVSALRVRHHEQVHNLTLTTRHGRDDGLTTVLVT